MVVPAERWGQNLNVLRRELEMSIWESKLKEPSRSFTVKWTKKWEFTEKKSD